MAELEPRQAETARKYVPFPVPVGVSNRHVHLSGFDLETLFGTGYELKVLKELSQPGEFAAQEVVTIVGPRGVIEGVRILGPTRDQTQIEISMTDAYRVGLRPPVRDSGDLDRTPGIAIVGPRGVIALARGVILAARHIHMSDDDAVRMGLRDGQRVSVHVQGERGQVMENVLIRVKADWVLEMHVDTDEANSALLKSGDKVHILQ